LISSLWVEHLLRPETGRGAVEQAEQSQVVRLGGGRRQLDDRRGPVEHLAATVEDEVVVVATKAKAMERGV
jgi:ketosteroid isomerase-like protein